MPTVIPEKFQDLLEKKIFVSLATLILDLVYPRLDPRIRTGRA